MNRKDVKEVIERYINDDFNIVDICLIGGTDFNYDIQDTIRYGLDYLIIYGVGYELRINYEDIKSIAI